jgi:ABC-type uncharacterized transport system permease subunit
MSNICGIVALSVISGDIYISEARLESNNKLAEHIVSLILIITLNAIFISRFLIWNQPYQEIVQHSPTINFKRAASM